MVKAIPPATAFHWRNTDYSNYFGSEILYSQEDNMKMMKTFLSRKELLFAAKALYHLFLLVQQVLMESKDFKDKLKARKEDVIKEIEKAREYLGLQRAIKMVGLTHQQYDAWKNKKSCALSPLNTCLKRYPNQIRSQGIAAIRRYLQDEQLQHWSMSSVYFKMVRDKAFTGSMTSFYRYGKKLGVSRPRMKKPQYGVGLRAKRAKELFHMDVTIMKLSDYSKVYLYVLMDNYSRFILNIHASSEYKAAHTWQNLRSGFGKYHLIEGQETSLMCDGGSENKGMVNDYLQELEIEKIVAQKDIRFSNSMVEAVNKRIKYDFLYRRSFDSLQTLQDYLPELVAQYNRTPRCLDLPLMRFSRVKSLPELIS